MEQKAEKRVKRSVHRNLSRYSLKGHRGFTSILKQERCLNDQTKTY